MVVRKVVILVMKTLSEVSGPAFHFFSKCVLYLKRTVDPNIKHMFQSIAIWRTDANQLVASTAEQTMLDVLKYGDDRQITEILPKLYDR